MDDSFFVLFIGYEVLQVCQNIGLEIKLGLVLPRCVAGVCEELEEAIILCFPGLYGRK